jgi:hypothetical protein
MMAPLASSWRRSPSRWDDGASCVFMAPQSVLNWPFLAVPAPTPEARRRPKPGRQAAHDGYPVESYDLLIFSQQSCARAHDE